MSTHKFRVFLWALLGYATIFFILLLLLTVLCWIILLILAAGPKASTIQDSILLAGFAFLLARSLWIRLDPPNGFPLSPEQAPELFEEVEEIRQKLDAPRVHQILLTDDFNAAMVQTPRLGLFGWHRNDLIVGLPMMLALSPEQYRAVIAHELGHLSRSHSRFQTWIYRNRESWVRLMNSLELKNHWGSFLFRKFFAWYLPAFDAATLELRRANEYEADRFAANIAGEKQVAEALIQIAVKGAFLRNEFWPAVFQEIENRPEPPAAVFSEMRRALETVQESDQANQWLVHALSEKTDSEDTHPSLSDRLAALGQLPRLPSRPPVTAANYFLGESLNGWIERMNCTWRESRLAAHSNNPNAR